MMPHGKRRHEDGRHRAHEAAHGVALGVAVRLSRCRLDLASALDVEVFQDLVVEPRDLRVDDDLVLAACGDNLDDTVRLLEHLGLCKLRVLEREAQPRYAVREGADVVRSSDTVHDGLSKCLAGICHPELSLAVLGDGESLIQCTMNQNIQLIRNVLND